MTHQDYAQTPGGTFELRELEAFQACENAVLAGVAYLIGTHTSEAGLPHFLIALRLDFGHGKSLLLSNEEEPGAIKVVDAAYLQQLEDMSHASTTRITWMSAQTQTLWEHVIGQSLAHILLTKTAEGLCFNDAICLDFTTEKILLIADEQREGLQLMRG